MQPPAGQPAAPQVPIPDASTDPFGAMGAMAQQAQVAAPRDIVVVNDGAHVESVSKQNKGAVIGKMAAMILAPLVAGVLIGKLSAGANQYNKVIEDATPIMEDVKVVRRGLTELTAVLESGKKGESFAPGDEKLSAALKALPAIEGNDELVFKSSLYHLDWKTASTIYGFYSDLHTLNTDLKAHLRAAKLESKILKEGAAKAGGFNPRAFGAVLHVPNAEDAAAGRPVTMKLVQLGAPVCAGQTKPNPEGCGGGPLAGIQHREDQLGGWKTDNLAPTGEEGTWGDSVVMLDTSKTLDQVVKGADTTVAIVAYDKRIKAIDALTQRLLQTSKNITKVLGEKANESGKFSFFL
jgi:hypothetical protein